MIGPDRVLSILPGPSWISDFSQGSQYVGPSVVEVMRSS